MLDGTQFLVEKSHPLLCSIHLAAPSSIGFFWPGDGEALHNSGSAQEAQHFHQSRMIETVVMLAIGLSMAGVVLGALTTDESV